MSDESADFATIISSELIAEIVEEYMNKTMFKKRVKIVDLSPTETGYLFSVAYADKLVKRADLTDKMPVGEILDQAETVKTGTEALLHHVEQHIVRQTGFDDAAVRQILEGAGNITMNGEHNG